MWLRKCSLACAAVVFCAVTAGVLGEGGGMHRGFVPLQRPHRASGASGGRFHRAGDFNDPPRRAEDAEETHNPLLDFWRSYKSGPGVHKWVSYFDVYHQYFKRFRGRNVRMLQIGVQSGGDIAMWRDYFVGGLEYHGMDINPRCKKFEGEPSVAEIIIGDQGSPQFWDELIPNLPMFDIIIDDGSHIMNHQILTLRKAFPTILAPGGVYLVEDTATSVWGHWGGSVASLAQQDSLPGAPARQHQRGQTFVEFSQSLVAELYWHHAMVKGKVPAHAINYAEEMTAHSPFWRKIKSIHFHNQIVVFLEGDVTEGNRDEKRGDQWIPYSG